ncbi:MAG: transglycosylase domain-containing protein, partial [Gemmatimonadetes bacterium]|nr:transglycosylase domain-containing protein [Gemmatimonadota bacterium]
MASVPDKLTGLVPRSSLLETGPSSSRPRLVAGAALLGLAFLGAAAGLVLGSWSAVCRDCPSVAQIYVWEPKQATQILTHDGELIAELFQERRTPVSLKDLPAYVPQAFVAVEDQQFYRHWGFNPWGIARAALNNLLHGRIEGGGSTITQQLARNMFQKEVGFEQRFGRKLKELKVARQLEQVYTKNQILEAYINQVNYGRGWFGIETAARRFFGKSATGLNPAEAALLAAVIKLPEHFSPFRSPERARARRNLVLGLMGKQGFLDESAVERWQLEPLPTRPRGADEGEFAPYFVEWVRDQLDDRYGSELYSKGLRIHTTLDARMQRAARTAMETGWEYIEKRPAFRHLKYAEFKAQGGTVSGNETPYLQGVFIALDPHSGEIRAMIGGRDFQESKFNRAVQARRQPGSVFKPFVYTAALASGIPASHVIYDSPIMLDQVDGTTWA